MDNGSLILTSLKLDPGPGTGPGRELRRSRPGQRAGKKLLVLKNKSEFTNQNYQLYLFENLSIIFIYF